LNSSGNTAFSLLRDANSDALPDDFTPIDPDVAEVAEAWPTLPQAVRAGILAMIRAAATA
jgi:hypothetical protein